MTEEKWCLRSSGWLVTSGVSVDVSVLGMAVDCRSCSGPGGFTDRYVTLHAILGRNHLSLGRGAEQTRVRVDPGFGRCCRKRLVDLLNDVAQRSVLRAHYSPRYGAVRRVATEDIARSAARRFQHPATETAKFSKIFFNSSRNIR